MQTITARNLKRQQAADILAQLGFKDKQCNFAAAYSLLACLDLTPDKPWSEAKSPLVGITPIIEFVGTHYGIRYAPNTRETIRDEAIKHFTEFGLLVRNPDNQSRPTNSAKTVYQIESTALSLIRCYGLDDWPDCLTKYLKSRAQIQAELLRKRQIHQIPVRLPSGKQVTISPGGQNPLIKQIIESFCPRFVPGGTVVYIGDAADKFKHLDKDYLHQLGVDVPAPAKMPDVVIHDTRRNWLVSVEAVTSDGPVDPKRRKELKELFEGCKAGLVFVSAFSTRQDMRSFLHRISWETEVWVADSPDHMIHFNGERFLGPYSEARP